MPRTATKVTQADIARALRAAAQVGAHVVIEITPEGVIRLTPHDAVPKAPKNNVEKWPDQIDGPEEPSL